MDMACIADIIKNRVQIAGMIFQTRSAVIVELLNIIRELMRLFFISSLFFVWYLTEIKD